MKRMEGGVEWQHNVLSPTRPFTLLVDFLNYQLQREGVKIALAAAPYENIIILSIFIYIICFEKQNYSPHVTSLSLHYTYTYIYIYIYIYTDRSIYIYIYIYILIEVYKYILVYVIDVGRHEQGHGREQRSTYLIGEYIQVIEDVFSY